MQCSHAYHQQHLFPRLRTHKVRSLTSQGATFPVVSTRGQSRPLALQNNVATSEHASKTETTQVRHGSEQMNRRDRYACWFVCPSLDSLAIPRQIIPKRGHRHRSPHTRDLCEGQALIRRIPRTLRQPVRSRGCMHPECSTHRAVPRIHRSTEPNHPQTIRTCNVPYINWLTDHNHRQAKKVHTHRNVPCSHRLTKPIHRHHVWSVVP